MAKCHNCDKLITKKSPVLECSRCQKVVHATAGCTGLSSKQLTALRVAENLEWTCNDCSHNSSRKKSFVTLENYEEEEDEETNSASDNVDVRKLLQQLKKEVGTIVMQEMRALSESLQYCSEKVDEFAETVEVLTGRLKDLEKKQLHLENRNKNLELKVEVLEQKNHEMEQSLLADQIEIAGLPETSDKELPGIIEKIAVKLKAEKEDIVSVKRLASRKDVPGPVLVKLRRESIRQSLISTTRGVTILVRDFMPELREPAASQKLYIREALTPYHKGLLWQAKQDLKDAYQFIWCKEGRVLARKNENAKIHRIRSKSDIESLLSIKQAK